MDRTDVRLVIAGLLGLSASAASRALDMPGDGWWLVACWAAGALAALAAPSLAGVAAAVAGIVVFVAASVLWSGQYVGLAWFVVAAQAVIVGHGFLVVAMLLRARRIATLADRQVLVGLSIAAGLVLVFVLLAWEFARNPP